MKTLAHAVGAEPARAGWRTAPVLALALVGVAFGCICTTIAARDDHAMAWRVALEATSGALFLATGVVAHVRRPHNRVGLLMMAVAIGWFAEQLNLSMTDWVFSVGLMLSHASSGFLAHLVLAFPAGRLASRAERSLVATAYVLVFAVAPFGVLFQDCPPGRASFGSNLFMVTDRAQIVGTDCDRTVAAMGAAIAVGAVLVLVRRWARATPPLRRILAPVVVTGLIGGVASALTAIPNGPSPDAADWMFDIAFCTLPLAFLAGLVRLWLARSAVDQLLARLRGPVAPGELQTLLAGALGDVSLQVGVWTVAGALVDRYGFPMTLPEPGADRAVTMVERGGRPMAVLVHDPALTEDRHVLDALSAATGLALENQRLSERVSAHLVEELTFPTRIAAAADAERRRVERDLHDGAQQRLVSVLIGLRLAEQRMLAAGDPALAELLTVNAEGLETALRELREIARGTQPAALADLGLESAVRTLTQQCPLPVQVSTSGLPRLPVAVERAAYFVVCEALTNALRHAGAERVGVVLDHDASRLLVRVTDNGAGGARIGPGSGLTGLEDRIRTLRGQFTVDSPVGRGTRVEATLPC